MAYWEQVADVPHDGDDSYLEGANGDVFNVAVEDLALAAGEAIVAVAAAIAWREAGADSTGRPFLLLGQAGEQTVTAYGPGSDYDTMFVFSDVSPATGQPWTVAEVNGVLVGAVVESGAELRATQIGLHVFVYQAQQPTPPPKVVQPPRRRSQMNFQALESLTADGSDQPVSVPRGATLIVRPVGDVAEIRDVAGAAAKLTIPADTMVMLGPSYGQTVHVRATAGTTIELALT